MDFLPFFIGVGKLRYWYFTFYLLGLPVYLYGIFLLFTLTPHTSFQIKDHILTILSLGYLLLGIFSLINTLVYAKITNNYLFALFLFFGMQILFWTIGGLLGNNYFLLTLYFFFFLCITLYSNLKALAVITNSVHKPAYHKKQQ